jgi:hypothetical protein
MDQLVRGSKVMETVQKRVGLPAGPYAQFLQEAVLETEERKAVGPLFTKDTGPVASPGPHGGRSHLGYGTGVTFFADTPDERKVKIGAIHHNHAGRFPEDHRLGNLFFETP